MSKGKWGVTRKKVWNRNKVALQSVDLEFVLCHYCKVPLNKSEMTVDHLTPKSRGGSNAMSNLVPCCFMCNNTKANKTAAEFKPFV